MMLMTKFTNLASHYISIYIFKLVTYILNANRVINDFLYIPKTPIIISTIKLN